jgi:hypothetical protein
LGISDSFQFMLFQLVLLKLSAEKKQSNYYGWPIKVFYQYHIKRRV